MKQNLLTLTLNGESLCVPEGLSVAAALSLSGLDSCRISVTGQPRAAFCGMGICQECRVTVNGLRRLACQTLCQPGMRIERTENE
ncbi:(2Fe-2S)-binding protein [Serratia proteamaculans]|uniref:(2Fe-2S)-binding protein n=1 Tax=Serratia proteamaculans TaxID=28151 RepID=A0A5Q2V2B0_SERPR|nr:(2Fe-2S)-binding protein [Serratia proteamaculans]QGH59527.1 (2Fe-2S)-binding protein [Serratia proteamaculans]